jgi:hypothetical protein
MWEFTRIREIVIKELSKFPIEALDKVLFGKEYKVFTLLMEGYLCWKYQSRIY